MAADGQTTSNPGAESINEILAAHGKTVTYYAFVPATGTTDQGDHLHFDAASARLMGQRYAQAMHQLQENKHK